MLYYKAVRLDYTSHWDKTTKWTPGVPITVNDCDKPEIGACGKGIHLCERLVDTVLYQWGRSTYFTVEAENPIASDQIKSRFQRVLPTHELTQSEQDKISGFKLWEINHPVNPFLINNKSETGEWLLEQLKQWVGILRYIRANQFIGYSSGASPGDEWNLGLSLYRHSWHLLITVIMSTVFESMRDSVGENIYRNSAINAFQAYIASLCPRTAIRDELSSPELLKPLTNLWYAGYVPIFDGQKWNLHAGQEGRIVLSTRLL